MIIAKPVRLEVLEEVILRWLVKPRAEVHGVEPGEGPWPSVSQGSISLSGQGDSVEENCLDEQVLKELQSLGGDDQPDFLNVVIQQFLDDQGKHTTAY